MNVTVHEAMKLVCPVMSSGKQETLCMGNACMWWQYDEPMFDGPDSYVSEPGPTGHCGKGNQETQP